MILCHRQDLTWGCAAGAQLQLAPAQQGSSVQGNASWRLPHAPRGQQPSLLRPGLAGSLVGRPGAGWAQQHLRASSARTASSQARSLGPRAADPRHTAPTRFAPFALTRQGAAVSVGTRFKPSSSSRSPSAAGLAALLASRHGSPSRGWLQQLPHHGSHQAPAAALASQLQEEPSWQQVLAGQLGKAPCAPSQHPQLQQQQLQLARPILLTAPSYQATTSSASISGSIQLADVYAEPPSAESSPSSSTFRLPEVYGVPESAEGSLILAGLRAHLSCLDHLDDVHVDDLGSVTLSRCLGSGTYAEVS